MVYQVSKDELLELWMRWHLQRTPLGIHVCSTDWSCKQQFAGFLEKAGALSTFRAFKEADSARVHLAISDISRLGRVVIDDKSNYGHLPDVPEVFRLAMKGQEFFGFELKDGSKLIFQELASEPAEGFVGEGLLANALRAWSGSTNRQ